jgi:hypothetical protein
MVRSLPVSVVNVCVERQSPPDVLDLRPYMVELIHGHSVNVLTRSVEVWRCASR